VYQNEKSFQFIDIQNSILASRFAIAEGIQNTLLETGGKGQMATFKGLVVSKHFWTYFLSKLEPYILSKDVKKSKEETLRKKRIQVGINGVLHEDIKINYEVITFHSLAPLFGLMVSVFGRTFYYAAIVSRAFTYGDMEGKSYAVLDSNDKKMVFRYDRNSGCISVFFHYHRSSYTDTMALYHECMLQPPNQQNEVGDVIGNAYIANSETQVDDQSEMTIPLGIITVDEAIKDVEEVGEDIAIIAIENLKRMRVRRPVNTYIQTSHKKFMEVATEDKIKIIFESIRDSYEGDGHMNALNYVCNEVVREPNVWILENALKAYPFATAFKVMEIIYSYLMENDVDVSDIIMPIMISKIRVFCDSVFEVILV
jgi:hypothetical protein